MEICIVCYHYFILSFFLFFIFFLLVFQYVLTKIILANRYLLIRYTNANNTRIGFAIISY